MNLRAPVRSLRFGDPLRRAFLDELRRRVLLPRVLSGEWALAKADLTIAVVDQGGGPVLVLAAGTLDQEERRWVLRQSLEDFEAGDLVEARATELVAAGHDPEDARALARQDAVALVEATVEALERVAQMRPEQASVPRALATCIRSGIDWLDLDGEHKQDTAIWHAHPDLDGHDEDPHERHVSAGVDDPFAGYHPGDEGVEEFDEDQEDDDDEGEEEEEESERFSSSVRKTRPVPQSARTQTPRPAPGAGGRGAARTAVWVLILGALVAAIAFGAGRSSGEKVATGDQADTPSPTAAQAVLVDHTVASRNADNTAVRFDPCRSYEYVVQPGSLTPEEARAEAGAAFAALEEAIGFAFRFAGYSTTRFPHPIDPNAPPTLPILVSYERVSDSPALIDGQHEGREGALPLGGLAVGTPRQVREGYTVIVGGALVIDEGLTADQRARILLHELGHLAGLGHANDPSQIMSPTVPDTGPIAYREGDRAGLAEVGAGSGCAMSDAERAAAFS